MSAIQAVTCDGCGRIEMVPKLGDSIPVPKDWMRLHIYRRSQSTGALKKTGAVDICSTKCASDALASGEAA